DPSLPLAVFFVGGDKDLGPASLALFAKAYGADYTQILFISIGVMDYAVLDAGVDKERGFEGTEEAGRLRERTRRLLDPLVVQARRLGLKVDLCVSIATNPVEEIDKLSVWIGERFPKAVCFVPKLIFRKWAWIRRLLHGRTSDEIRERLERRGLRVRMLPLVLSE